MSGLQWQRIEGVGQAHIFKGDPRAVQSAGIDTWYQEMLHQSAEPKARVHLYGADAGLCARRNVLLAHNTWIANEVTPASSAYMRIGVALEDMLASALQSKGKLLVQNMWLTEIPGLLIRGKIDLTVLDHEDELSLIEVKTCGKLPDSPKPPHLAQIQTYAAVSGIHRCWLTYISREVRFEYGPNLALRTFAVDCGEETLRERLKIAVLSRDASLQRTLPPIPPHFRKHTECHYCEFRDYACWKPRPGLAKAEEVETETPLLAEMKVDAYINLEHQAERESKLLYANTPQRYLSTLEHLLTYPLSSHQEDKIRLLKEQCISNILS